MHICVVLFLLFFMHFMRFESVCLRVIHSFGLKYILFLIDSCVHVAQATKLFLAECERGEGGIDIDSTHNSLRELFFKIK